MPDIGANLVPILGCQSDLHRASSVSARTAHSSLLYGNPRPAWNAGTLLRRHCSCPADALVHVIGSATVLRLGLISAGVDWHICRPSSRLPDAYISPVCWWSKLDSNSVVSVLDYTHAADHEYGIWHILRTSRQLARSRRSFAGLVEK